MENLDTLEVKLTDFGFATFYDEESKLKQALGSPYYMAPEICKNKEYDTKCDVWSAGIIIYFLFTGKYPFMGHNISSL